MTTKIEWTDETWNPVTGCTKVSTGCANCYAERMSKRLAGRFGYSADDPFRVTLHPNRLDEPLRWRKPRQVFVCSMGDLFHPQVPRDFILKVWRSMVVAPQHVFQVLTKRPERANELLTHWLCPALTVALVPHQWPLPNVWLGVSVEDQDTWDTRVPELLQTPAAVRFVSYEPALGPMKRGSVEYEWAGQRLDWVICGGETGPGARPMHPDWARSLRDQCAAAGVPFFFKRDSAGNRKLDGVIHDAMPETPK